MIAPGLAQFIPEGFQGNVTFFCSVSMPSNNSAVWVINNLQIVPERISELEPFGIFIVYNGTRATLSVDTTVRSDFSSIGLQCAESVPGPTPSVAFSDPLAIFTYGR